MLFESQHPAQFDAEQEPEDEHDAANAPVKPTAKPTISQRNMSEAPRVALEKRAALYT